MSQPAVRLTDVCSGHGCYPPRPNSSASPNVFTNNLAQHRQGDSWKPHGCGVCSPHGGVAVSGSSTVFVNNKQLFRRGDPISCGSKGNQHSPNVFVGG